MFPGVRDPVGPPVAFRMPHALLFPVEMPTDTGCLVGTALHPKLTSAVGEMEAEAGARGRWFASPRALKSPLALPPPASQPPTQLTWTLQHPRDTPMPRGEHPRHAWPSPQAAKPKLSTGDGGNGATGGGGGILTPGRGARADPNCRQASTVPREQDPAQLCCSHGALQLSRPAGRICSGAKGKPQH